MRWQFKALLSGLLALTMLVGGAQAASDTESPDEENYQKILEHNIEIKSVWLNPGDYVSQSIDDEYVELAAEIVGDSTNEAEKTNKIYDWVTSNIYYDYDARYGSPSITEEEREAGMTRLQLRRGVCENYATILKNLLNAEGIPCFVIHGRICDRYTASELVNQSTQTAWVIGKWTSQDVERTDSNHAWNAIYLDGEWLEVDPTWDSANKYRNGEYKKGSNQRGYFNPGDAMMSLSHKITTYASTYESNVPDQWAMEEISDAFANKLVPYDLQGDYREAITRKDFCRLAMSLWRHFNGENNENSPEPPFDDTDDIDIAQAYNLGIVRGVSNTQFDPGRNITREEAATMLMRIAKMLEYPNVSRTPLLFSDIGEVSDWGLDGVNYVSTNGIMQGSGNHFAPKENYSIQQAIVTFYRIFNNMILQ